MEKLQKEEEDRKKKNETKRGGIIRNRFKLKRESKEAREKIEGISRKEKKKLKEEVERLN
jgi:hypothetical protein